MSDVVITDTSAMTVTIIEILEPSITPIAVDAVEAAVADVTMAVDMAAVTEAAVAAAPEPISSTEHLYILLLI